MLIKRLRKANWKLNQLKNSPLDQILQHVAEFLLEWMGFWGGAQEGSSTGARVIFWGHREGAQVPPGESAGLHAVGLLKPG